MIIKRFVSVSDTDFTKALYFTSALKYAQEGFEQLVRERFSEVYKQILEEKVLFPIVHTEGSFFSPIKVFDQLKIELKISLKNSSFDVLAKIFHNEKLKAEAKITHVCIDRESGKKISSKEIFHELLVS